MSQTAYLGPPGTFCHRAAQRLAPGADLQPMDTPVAVVEAVASGMMESGVVPFENSIEGEINATLDVLADVAPSALIVAESIMEVSFTLFRAAGDDTPLQAVISHPAALTQCRRFLRQAGVHTQTATSTAAACAQLAADPQPGVGALAAPETGQGYGLVPSGERLEDTVGASTRFVQVAQVAPPETGRDRSAFIIQPRQDQPGGLVHILQGFSLRGVNLTAITSRPARDQLGNYWFYLECEGHIAGDTLRAITMGLLTAGETIRFLGSFPEDPGRPLPARPRDYATAYRAYREMVGRVAGQSALDPGV